MKLKDSVISRLIAAGAQLKEVNGESVLELNAAGEYIVYWWNDTSHYHDGLYRQSARSASLAQVVVSTGECIHPHRFGTPTPREKNIEETISEAFSAWLAEADLIGEKWKTTLESKIPVMFSGYEDGDYMDAIVPITTSDGVDEIKIAADFLTGEFPDDLDPETDDPDDYSYPALKERITKMCIIYGFSPDNLHFPYDEEEGK